MVTNAPETIIARKQFAINADQQRVSYLLAKAIYQCLPLERMNIVDDKTFRADLKWHVAFVPIRLYLEGKFQDVALPDFLSCRLSVKRGILHLGVKVAFTLKPIKESLTEVTCDAVADREDAGGLLGRILSGAQKGFAEGTFESLRVKLGQLC